MECIVARTSFRRLTEIESKLNNEVKLELKREPKNKYDAFAIPLYFQDKKVGYIPKDKNETIARLLDAGKNFYASINAKEWEGNWLRIEIKIFLKD